MSATYVSSHDITAGTVFITMEAPITKAWKEEEEEGDGEEEEEDKVGGMNKMFMFMVLLFS